MKSALTLILYILTSNIQQMSKLDKSLALEDETEVILGIGQLLWDKSKNDQDFESLNEYEKNFLYIDMLEGQVNNGGFDQFFFNSSGDYSHEALRALEEIGASKTADLVEQAIKAFPSLPIPKDTEVRRPLMNDLPESISDTWDELDGKYYEYPEDIAGLIIEYVKKNKDKFQ